MTTLLEQQLNFGFTATSLRASMAFPKGAKRRSPLICPNHSEDPRIDLFDWVHPIEEVVAPISSSDQAKGETKKLKTGHVDQCFGCETPVSMLPRNGFRQAWTEASVQIKSTKRYLYWCQDCTEDERIFIPLDGDVLLADGQWKSQKLDVRLAAVA